MFDPDLNLEEYVVTGTAKERPSGGLDLRLTLALPAVIGQELTDDNGIVLIDDNSAVLTDGF